MSKQLFELMREAEISTNNFLPTKKEVKKSAELFAKDILDNGNHNIKEVYSQALRLKEALATIESTLKESLGEDNFEEFGIVGTFRNGGNTINYKEDEVYSELKEKLDERVEVLKLAQKQDVLDEYSEFGTYVPKVSTTPRKSSLAISF